MLAPARIGAALLAAGLLTGLATGPALADSGAPSAPASATAPSSPPAPAAAPSALYGKSDPTYDGVYRQSLALLALKATGQTPPTAAVDWLKGQQCTDGGWPSFRADTGTACAAATEDSNATALAMQALVALGGHQDAVDKGTGWLKANQNADGSWSYNPGNAGDANSTGLAVSALHAAGVDPKTVAKQGKSGVQALTALQLDCKAAADQRGALAYQAAAPGAAPAANALATAQAGLALADGSLPVTAGSAQPGAPKPLDCSGAVAPAEGSAAYLVGALGANDRHLMLAMPGAAPTPDFAATSWAVLSLAKAGYGAQAGPAVDWLSANAAGWLHNKSGTDAAATATLILTAKAAGRDPHSFAGTDLVSSLAAAGPAAPSAATSTPATKHSSGSGGLNPFWIAGGGLLIGIGYGVYLSKRKRQS
ncbi:MULTISPECIES: prenyltransferase/squalene oxidase repeat-containing protein [Kitasatospora]|uniref:prenyltransferase/squalene oxidase repeat-containing protein n=1 Tax=Kitasatospora TaxID=2063 RepID=UPI000C6FF339|nr:prenyltransferase/squalene oxidase repeat-containing protein [Kitasatospora sp. GP30]MDH6138971.1 hypothetical protein [Kitasatospora sp. GP30]